jgi:hypothetical protein
MTTFDATALVAAVIILLTLAACTLIGILYVIAGALIDLLAPGRGRREAFRHTALDDIADLVDATGCTWCDTGTGDCTCTSHCTFIPGCRAEWTTTVRRDQEISR